MKMTPPRSTCCFCSVERFDLIFKSQANKNRGPRNPREAWVTKIWGKQDPAKPNIHIDFHLEVSLAGNFPSGGMLKAPSSPAVLSDKLRQMRRQRVTTGTTAGFAGNQTT